MNKSLLPVFLLGFCFLSSLIADDSIEEPYGYIPVKFESVQMDDYSQIQALVREALSSSLATPVVAPELVIPDDPEADLDESFSGVWKEWVNSVDTGWSNGTAVGVSSRVLYQKGEMTYEILTLSGWTLERISDGTWSESPFRVRVIGFGEDEESIDRSLADDFRRQWALSVGRDLYDDDSVPIVEILGTQRFVAEPDAVDFFVSQEFDLLDGYSGEKYGRAVLEVRQKSAYVCRILTASRPVLVGDRMRPLWSIGLKTMVYGDLLINYGRWEYDETSEGRFDGLVGVRQTVTREMYRVRPFVGFEWMISEFYKNPCSFVAGVELNTGIRSFSFQPSVSVGLLWIPEMENLLSHMTWDVELRFVYQAFAYGELSVSTGYKGGFALFRNMDNSDFLDESQFMQNTKIVRLIPIRFGVTAKY